MRDEYDLLARARFVELRPQPGAERIATLAMITFRGDAELVARRKAAEAGMAHLSPPAYDRYDIFLSHASEDNDYALPLYYALSQHFRVFIDKTGLRAGASFPGDIGKAIAASEWGVFIVSPCFHVKRIHGRRAGDIPA